jgi:hypothetical protein
VYWEKAFKCSRCDTIQRDCNDQVCEQCGSSEKLYPTIARLVDDAGFWDDIFHRDKTRWEEKPNQAFNRTLEEMVRSFLHNLVHQKEKVSGNLESILKRIYPEKSEPMISEKKEKIIDCLFLL